MKIRFLGAHNCESQGTKLVSLLIDGVLAIDAGALTSSLSFAEQLKIKAILLTHQHYDHIRDIPALAMNLFLRQATVNVYSISAVGDALAAHLLNGEVYSEFLQRPQSNPTLKFTVVEPDKPLTIEGYSVLAVPVSHGVPAVGYQLTSADGKAVFYSGDTGPGLAECWRRISPQLIIIEVTASDKYKDWAAGSGHLTPGLLEQELTSFRELNGYIPQVVAVHMSPHLEEEIAAEIEALGRALGGSITLAYEGMELSL
ncbi:MAG TPA: MBL fold metallo-hydrolase [Dehalococcoidia bacterium]|nr:MBL fold metallo-hydrolase [Dehalococcoidia bacterium]